MPSFTTAPAAVADLIREAMRKYHPNLIAAEVSISALLASSPDGEPLKERGVSVPAIIRINNYRDRVKGMTDATVEIDAIAWEEKSEEERVALLDRELEWLELVRDKKTKTVKTDNAGRPKLKRRRPDFAVSGRWGPIERHRRAALEVNVWLSIIKTAKQKSLWADMEGDES